MAFLWSDRIFFPFSCWPVFLDKHTKLSHRLRGSRFLAYLIIRVLRFLSFLSTIDLSRSRSLRMSTLAVTFPCRFFFPGSEIDLAFPYLPFLIVGVLLYPVGKSPTLAPFRMFFRYAFSLRWYLLWHFGAGVGFCFYAPFPLSVDRSPGHRWVLMNIYQGKLTVSVSLCRCRCRCQCPWYDGALWLYPCYHLCFCLSTVTSFNMMTTKYTLFCSFAGIVELMGTPRTLRGIDFCGLPSHV